MAEQDKSQERTEQATPKRRQDARKKGQAPRSRELNTTAVLLAGAGTLVLFGGAIGEGIAAIMIDSLSPSRELAFDAPLLPTVFGQSAMVALVLLLPLFAAVLIAALAGPAMLGGLVFSAQALQPKLEKLNPIAGLKRIFSLNGLMEFAKTLAKFVVVTGAGLLVLRHIAPDLLMAGEASIETAVPGLAAAAAWVLVVLASVMLLIAAVDVPFQLWNHSKQLRMTRQEVRDEMKETEGRPEVKGRIRQLQQEMSRRRMLKDLPTADVIVTNPSHFAVALRYDETRMRAPVVVAKGVEHLAARIREIGREHRIPVFEAPPLARALYWTTEIGHPIPASLYLAVAQVLTYVLQLRRANQGQGHWPDRPQVSVDPALAAGPAGRRGATVDRSDSE